ncbi:PA14 domain-containing protein [Streptomyces sp. NPDC051286]|uniref:PA14 domain-containing protein n=1 Tax=Streptomyces sp. NPDC051286 TaxID=3365647 RepID=UPI0037B58B39
MPQRFRAACATAAAAGAAVAGLAVPTTAHAATTCADGVWKATYYPNTSFYGTPKLTTCDSSISEDYATGDPAGVTLPSDNFTVRWQTTRNFGSGGPFTFTTAVRDGIRVYVDGVRKIDLWKNVSTTQTKTLNLTIPSGRHTIRVDFVAFTGSANVKFTYAPRTSATVDTVKPLAPTGVSAAYDPAALKATIRWAKSPEMDLVGYHVYRRPAGTSTWTRQTSTPLTTTSHTNTPPATGAAYQYVVRAVDKAGNESGGSTLQSVTSADRTPPAAPFVELDVCATDEKVAGPELVTTAANAADIALYQAQRRDPATGDWTTVHSGTKGAFCDTGQPSDGTKATYRGRARDAAGNWSVYSAATTFTTFDRTPPATAADARVEYRSGVPHLVWSPVTGAASYQVLQYDPATGGYLDALPGTGTTTATDVVPRQLLAVTNSYRYAVRALDAKGNAAAPVEITLAMADRPEAIPAYKTTATRFGEGVVLEWWSADPWTFDGGPMLTYKIVRTDTATGESSTVDKCKPGSAFDGPLQDPSVDWWWAGDDAPAHAGRKVLRGTCWDVSGASETTYEYRIVTVDPYGHTSQPGPAATETTPDTKRPDPVQNLTAERIPLGVRLTWTPPADEDVTGYYVWQGTTDPDTGATIWKKNCWRSTSLAATEILCPTVPDGATHVYRVAATDDPARYMDEGPDFFHTADISVTLPDTRPPGWTGTTVREDQYPELYVGCSESAGLDDCSRLTDYRVERWDAASASYVTLKSAKVGSPTIYMDTTVHEDLLGLYYYRVVYTDASGTELAVRQQAYGIWDSWL